MSRSPDDFTIGVEEEFQLVDPETRELRPGVDQVLPEAQERTSAAEVSHELQQSQIEIGTPVCRTLAEARAELVRLRAEVRESAAHRGLTIVAAGSHPSSRLDHQRITEIDDYRQIADNYAHLADEQVVFGCHVHVGVADRELAIAAMNHIRPWLAPLVALSSSSPFWSGADTGYASYRSEVFGRWPTAGAAEPFASRAEYEEVVDQLLSTGSIDAPARIYWDVRPSARYDTLELRVADVCTSVDDAVLVAGLAGALVRQGVTCAEAGEPHARRPPRTAARRALARRAVRHHRRPGRPPDDARRPGRRRGRAAARVRRPRRSTSGASATRSTHWPASCSPEVPAPSVNAPGTRGAVRSPTSSTGSSPRPPGSPPPRATHARTDDAGRQPARWPVGRSPARDWTHE